jgi:hypothetical protein
VRLDETSHLIGDKGKEDTAMKLRLPKTALLTIALLSFAAIEAMGQKTPPPDPRIHGNTIPTPTPFRPAPPPTVVTDTVGRPVPPVRGRFRITLNGFTCVRPTTDSPDDVYFEAYVRLMTTHPGEGVDQVGVLTPFFGDSTHRSGLNIRGGSATGTGGFRAGDSYPTNTPWLRLGVPASTGASGLSLFPALLWEGELTQGQNGVWIIPTIWRGFANTGLDTPYLFGIQHTYRDLDADVSNVVAHRGGPTFDTDVSTRFVNEFNQVKLSPLLLGGVPSTTRPIGLFRQNGDEVFVPQAAFILTYDAAQQLASRPYPRGGSGIYEFTYRDDDHLEGNYTLYMQVERLP